MFSSLTKLSKGRTRIQTSPFPSSHSVMLSSPIAARRTVTKGRRKPTRDYKHNVSSSFDGKIDEGQHEEREVEGQDDEGQNEDDDEDGDEELIPLLPIFSAEHLDAIPVYNLTHTIRLLVVPRCETTLSWDQLRSPQVSQFLVKPIQQQIRTSHFSRATLYALMANCLQFNKEVQMNPGNSGANKTRALVCELLAIKLLKEFSTRELTADALSYDFYPLQGLVFAGNGNVTPAPNLELPIKAKPQPRVARISTLEIAIRAQSKRFLAHPLVVQQLEAIWAGNIVFHSSADNLHRSTEKSISNLNRGYGTLQTGEPGLQVSSDELRPAKQRDHRSTVTFSLRRSVTLYDPKDASLFKLSRLRVPRYRQFLSTLSLAILLGLFLAVLIERSLEITPLEVVFWFWSAGFMLDEVVGFNEQGFSLYIMSFWNSFDVGILMLLVCFYCMRLYGILMPDVRKHAVASMAYDLLASNAVLLFPRLFSVLDHYRYFSQLLIAFRMMAVDLVAVFILIIISCSGFFVAFTLSFGNDDYDAGGVAYALFQMLMGFTPAAWDTWPKYNLLGKGILTLFLFICHFLIVTILITVLTNSFMAIVQNANEEHQFVFAVNAISMVKSDALFSYIAPANIFAWILTPLRFFLPFRQFVRLNRTVIKVTHFPVLFIIYVYERMILRGASFAPTDLVERGRSTVVDQAREGPEGRLTLFSPRQNRLREPSVATFQKDRALEEVFRQPFRNNTTRNTRQSHDRRKMSNVVNSWMQNMGPDGTPSPPLEQDRAMLDNLEAHRLAHRRSQFQLRRRQAGRGRAFTEATISVASDPEDFVTGRNSRQPPNCRENSGLPLRTMDDLPEQTDADGDDELITNDEDENMTLDRTPDFNKSSVAPEAAKNAGMEEEDYFQMTTTANSPVPHLSSSYSSNRGNLVKLDLHPPIQKNPERPSRGHHKRNFSTNTVLHAPLPQDNDSSSSPSRKGITARNSAKNAGSGSGALTPASAGRRTPKRLAPGIIRARPIMPPRSAFQSAPNLEGMFMLDHGQGGETNFAMELGSDIGDNKAVGGGFVGAIPSSFATQLAYASGAMRAGQVAAASENEDQRMMGKLMLARMNALEEGFREVLKEVKEWRKEETRSVGEERLESKVAHWKHRKGKGKMKAKIRDDGPDWVDQDDIPREVPKDEKGSSI